MLKAGVSATEHLRRDYVSHRCDFDSVLEVLRWVEWV